MFSHKSEIEKADHLGQILVGCATETASVIIERLTSFAEGISFRDSNIAPQFVIEFIVFYMHLVDRMAFAHLGAAKREAFGDRFIVAVVKEFLEEISREMSADTLGNALRDTYNRRQLQYAKYKVLIPKKDDPLNNTLYWEFSKILFNFLDDTNPATLMFLNLLVADMTKIMLNDALKVDEVLRS
jgi:hypothetical protein